MSLFLSPISKVLLRVCIFFSTSFLLHSLRRWCLIQHRGSGSGGRSGVGENRSPPPLRFTAGRDPFRVSPYYPFGLRPFARFPPPARFAPNDPLMVMPHTVAGTWQSTTHHPPSTPRRQLPAFVVPDSPRPHEVVCNFCVAQLRIAQVRMNNESLPVSMKHRHLRYPTLANITRVKRSLTYPIADDSAFCPKHTQFPPFFRSGFCLAFVVDWKPKILETQLQTGWQRKRDTAGVRETLSPWGEDGGKKNF